MKQEPFHCEWFFSFRSDGWMNTGKEYNVLYETKTTCQTGGKSVETIVSMPVKSCMFCETYMN